MKMDFIAKEKCTGCGGCVNVCVHHAAFLETDSEGFRYPKVDPEKCIDCGICLQKCPLAAPRPTNQTEPEAFACFSKDSEIRIQSTSGGIFNELAKMVLSDGGVVIGARYTKDFMVEHAAAFSEKEIPFLRQSKYLQSDTRDIYRKTEEWLKMGLRVLFCGTPCQNAALRCCLGKDYENLIRCDFICRGVASPKVFRKYLDMLETQYGSNIKTVQFKNKDAGWHNFGTRICFQNGSSYHGERFHDPFMTGYLEYNLFLRPSCHHCRFKGSREGDLTLGDFWGIETVYPELDTDQGTSAVILNSEKGKAAFERIKPQLVWAQCRLEEIGKGNPCLDHAVRAGKNRRKFFADIDRCTFRELAEKYAAPQKLPKLHLRRILSRLKRTVQKERMKYPTAN